MRLLLYCVLIIVLTCLSVQATCRGNRRRKERKLIEGEGIIFPKRSLSKSDVEMTVFDRKLYVIYRLGNPVLETFEDLELFHEMQANGDVIQSYDLRVDGSCVAGTFLYNAITDDCNTTVYTSEGPFLTTGEGMTASFFSRCPEDYVFIFFCFDRTKEVIRHGRRVFCDGPWGILFATYEFPPDQVKWCKAETDLWKNFCLTFNNEFMRYEPSGQRCPSGDDDEDDGDTLPDDS